MLFIAGEKITFAGTLTDEHGQVYLKEKTIQEESYISTLIMSMLGHCTHQSNATTNFWNITYDIPQI